MRISIIILLTLFSFTMLHNCCDCKKTSGNKIAVTGKISWESWKLSAGWGDYSAQDYNPDLSVIQDLNDVFNKTDSLEFIVFSASWCDDSESEVPKIFKLFDMCSIDKSKIILYGLNRQKQEATGAAIQYKIEKVPTLIILLSGDEIGRIVEFPTKSWEKDIFEILD